MTAKKKSLVFIIICCCLLTVPVFLSGPAGALTSQTVAITGNIPLVIYDVSVTSIDRNNATVTWNTNENANSAVKYGTTTSYGSLITDGVMTESHTISIYNLTPGTVYHYFVISFDVNGNHAVSSDLTFTTTPLSPPTVVPTAPIGGVGGLLSRIYYTYTGPGAPQQAVVPQLPQLPAAPEQPVVQNIPGSQPAAPQEQTQTNILIPAAAIMQSVLGGGPLYLLIIAVMVVLTAYFLWQRRQKKN
jgi:hypothetical protein